MDSFDRQQDQNQRRLETKRHYGGLRWGGGGDLEGEGGRGQKQIKTRRQRRHATHILTGIVNLKSKVFGPTHLRLHQSTFGPEEDWISWNELQSARLMSASLWLSLLVQSMSLRLCSSVHRRSAATMPDLMLMRLGFPPAASALAHSVFFSPSCWYRQTFNLVVRCHFRIYSTYKYALSVPGSRYL